LADKLHVSGAYSGRAAVYSIEGLAGRPLRDSIAAFCGSVSLLQRSTVIITESVGGPIDAAFAGAVANLHRGE